MVGRFWTFTIDPARASDFERLANDEALPLAQAGMGCVAVFALRGAVGGHYAWLTFWVSRRALAVALASPEWKALEKSFASLGASLEQDRATSYETVGVFLAGERAAGHRPGGGND